ncbi:MAG TPA: hypothetical protein VFC03_17085 [Acidimicrobiales bacterium]|nr:hypothetical protein [Acidimicrobiales bacterium]
MPPARQPREEGGARPMGDAATPEVRLRHRGLTDGVPCVRIAGAGVHRIIARVRD